MASFNKVILAGNLTRDPEMKFTPKGSAVCQFGMAVNRKWKDANGQLQEEVTFVDLQAWGGTAENIAKYFRKGSSILIDGRLSQDTWEDKQAGQKKSKTRVVVESFSFLERNQNTPSHTVTTTPKITPADIPGADDVPF